MKFAPHLRAAALLTAVALLPATTAGLAQVESRVSPEFSKLFATYQRIKTSYVEEVSDEVLIRGAIDGMLAALDPHSAYLEGASFQRLTTMIDGKYQGLGISVQMDQSTVKVVSPFKGSPAEKAGIKAGDYITHIEGKLIYGLELDEAVEQMRGEAGGRLGGLVLDWRRNPGGSLDEAVALSDLFLSDGQIVSQRGRGRRDTIYYDAESVFRGDVAEGTPMIVLIDAGSASASEIVAGALQDQRRAVIMGERSFGKGSVQSLLPLTRESALKLTTARYYTPSGRSVQEGGIEPDIRVPQLSDPDAALRAKYAYRESDLRRHLVNEVDLEDEALEVDTKEDPRFTASVEELKQQGIEDFQLHYAVQTLRRTGNVMTAQR